MAKEIKKELDNINETITKLGDDMEAMLDTLDGIEEITDISGLEASINKLKNATPTKKNNNVPPVDGETCMHGNSWHSNCMECDEMDDAEIALNEMGNIIDTTPNDKQLGEKIRDFYNKWVETNSDDTITTVD